MTDVERLSDLVERALPMPFARFMRLVLYHPELGYYATRVPGRDTGYETAPTLSPVFGRCLARFLEDCWSAIGRPERFDVVEAGPGAGDLAATALESSAPTFADAVRWRMVEPHPAVEEVQRAAVDDGRVTWCRTLREAGPVTGCVVANEVLDALPVHPCRWTSEGFLEGEVTRAAGRLELRYTRPPDDGVLAYLDRYAGRPEAGDVCEAGLEAVDWMREAAGAIARGYLLVIDYGDVVPELYRRRPDGTLLAYGGGRVHPDVLALPGRQDITAHVNFTAIRDAALEAGLREVALTTQRELLLAYGLREELDELRDRTREASGVDVLRLHEQRERAATLVRRGGMGDFRVLLMARDAPDPLG